MSQATLPADKTVGLPYINQNRMRNDLLLRRVGAIGLSLTPWVGYLFLWLPIVILIIFSFNNSSSNAQWQGFTTKWYEGIFQGQFGGTEARFNTVNLLQALQRSLIVGTVSTIIATILGTTVSIGLERYKVRFKTAIELLLYLPVVIPEITMGLSLLLFFSQIFNVVRQVTGAPVGLSLFTVIVGHVVFCMPFVAIVVRARLAGMSPSLEEAARDLGANEWKTFRLITLPILMPGILAGALLAFTLSLDDFVVTLFTSGPGGTTLPLFVYGMIKFQVTPDINAISTLIVIVSMSLVLFSVLMQNRRA